jgi:hypothetical protein
MTSRRYATAITIDRYLSRFQQLFSEYETTFSRSARISAPSAQSGGFGRGDGRTICFFDMTGLFG